MKSLKRGFTLIELMIVITVIAILAAMVLFGLNQAQRRARDVQRTQIMKAVQVALQGYASENNGNYPAGDWTITTPATGLLATYLPLAIIDPGCGAGTGGDVRGGPAPRVPAGGCAAPPAANGVSYQYAAAAGPGCPAGSRYTLTLIKEGGGTASFCAPQ